MRSTEVHIQPSSRPTGLPHRARRFLAAVSATLLGLGLVPGAVLTPPAAAAPVGQGFNLNASDLRFILKQIKIAEQHAATATPADPCSTLLGNGPDQIPNQSGQGVLLPWGLRTVDGSCNNLQPGQNGFASADKTFPRLAPSDFREAEPSPFGPPGPATSYEQTKGTVFDAQPRIISNLIVDQTATNPAAVDAAGLNPEVTPSGAFFIPNVAPDVGLSAPYNSWFTLFGQFFDHGLDLTSKSGGAVFMPLQTDDPLFDPNSPTNFMVLTRSTNQPGPDGVVGDDPSTPCNAPNDPVGCDESADDVKNATNQTSPFVDQSQTYTSHPSHQVFLREYENNGLGKPVATGKLITSADGGMGTWAAVKAQARTMLGIDLVDADALSVPLLATDPYGRFTRGPNGYPQMVTTGGLVEGDPTANAGLGVPVPTTVIESGRAFLDDIAHNAAPKPGLLADTDSTITGAGGIQDPGTYDDEMLGVHFIAGDGRLNENIGLTAVHHVFHSEHNRLTGDIQSVITNEDPTSLAEWQLPDGSWNGERLFQAARFVTEMEYQHLAFEEFARKVQPQVNLFAGYDTSVNSAITAEFAHAVYRFGHSMLTETVARTSANGTSNDIPLLDAFLNPPSFTENGTLTPNEAAGSIVRGMTEQRGNELDEFVTEALRNRLLGLPLDLASLNLARARETGVPSLNAVRREFFAATQGNSDLAPYANWNDFGLALKHPKSLINFVAAYGTHPTITGDMAARRDAAALLVAGDSNNPATPLDSVDFMDGTGTTWSNANGVTTTGLDVVDLWIGGLAEKQQPFGGLLGSTFNYVFETQMERLQDGDRLYYLGRTAGLNMLVQLEGNSFAELIGRNTDAENLPADSFSKLDFHFYLAAQAASGPIVDDPNTTYDETTLLIRTSDNTIRFNGPEHVAFHGTPGNDKVWSSEGDDTLRGNDGDDRLEGGAGNDSIISGLGNDVLTDTFGDDVTKGGDGNDAISSGQGFDLNQAGRGNDFVISGSDPTETFGGSGNDFIFGGDSSDIVFGDDGDDWIEGGGQADLLQGDNGAPFGDDPNTPGNDVIDGDGGNDDYDAEGGDDIMISGPGVERNEGMLGFDWVTHKTDPQAANSDMNFTGLLPPALDALRDRFDLVEGLSGWDKDDILRGDSLLFAPTPGEPVDPNALTNIALIDNLQGLLGAGVTQFSDGNIILGGAGSDLIEGRGGNDILDGDSWLNVQLRAPDLATPDPDDTRLYENMSQLRADVFAGRMHGGQISIVRTIESTLPGTAIDTAVFSEARANYDLELGATGVTVTHARGTQVDGTDSVRNIERLAFADITIEVSSIPANTPASGTVTISDTAPTENQLLTATEAVVDPDGIGPGGLTFTWEAESAPDTWVAVGTGTTFTPGNNEVGRRLRVVVTFLDGEGVAESVTSAPTDAVININDPATGAAVLSDLTPQEAVELTVATDTIADLDGLVGVTLDRQWQQSGLDGAGAFTDIAGATGASFTPGQDQVNRSLQVAVSFTDNHGTAEQILSVRTGVVGDLFVGTAGPDLWTGTAGDDRAFGGGGNDTLSALAGADVIAGQAGDDTVSGGGGDDVFQMAGTGDGFDAVTGGGGTDRIVATADATNIGLRSLASVEEVSSDGHAGVRVLGSAAANTLNLSAMTLTGILDVDGAAGADAITGTAAPNVLLGGAGADVLSGGAGDDVVTGGEQNDTMNGQAGNDRFVFGAGWGADRINGFDSNPAGGQDRLDVSSLGITAATFGASVNIVNLGARTLVVIGANSVRLNNVAAATVTAADFVLAP